MKDRTGEVWFDREGSTEPEMFLVTGGRHPAEFGSDEPGSVYHNVIMLFHNGESNGWREEPSRLWESLTCMRRIL